MKRVFVFRKKLYLCLFGQFVFSDLTSKISQLFVMLGEMNCEKIYVFTLDRMNWLLYMLTF